ncbi:MAG: 4-hydroxy-3-methylbut-2-enyl diphosphate reductase [bacterium]|nr:4-hydroxy-3-methylbut-2-enyl diphosphate reductase [bacterium]
MVKINVAKYSGFCFGVKRAVNMALEESRKSDNVIMLGDIVHNEHVVKKIDDAGVKVKNDLATDDPGTLLLRAHGAVPEVYKEASEMNYKVVDATCPLVLEIHEIVRRMAEEKYRIVVIGDYGHDEVIGISGQVKDAVIIAKPEDVKDKMPKKARKLGIVVQSTQNIDNARKIIAELVPYCQELNFVDTICKPTKLYQAEIRKMPHENDVMIIVGSFTSANTKRLTEISSDLNPRSYQVESSQDLEKIWFESAENIGITAGASTPDWIIEEVVDRIKELTD